MSSFRLSDYCYDLPADLIAQNPAPQRDGSRLLELKGEAISHHLFKDLPRIASSDLVFVANNTRVMAGRFYGERVLPNGKKGGQVEVVLLEPSSTDRPIREVTEFLCLMRSGGKQVPGFQVRLQTVTGEQIFGELLSEGKMRFDRAPFSVGGGLLPLPPYIERDAVAQDQDRYQTVYASQTGSAAAPTAGLHFTDAIKADLQRLGARWIELTLHVGVGTFRPVKADDIRQHEMHSEWFSLPPETAQELTTLRSQGRKIVAVGTTTTRVLESCWDRKAQSYQSKTGRTSIFLYPGCRLDGEKEIAGIDSLITNFHLPGSTLLMLVSAFAGREKVMGAYQEAIKNRYRFFSYGDAMWVTP